MKSIPKVIQALSSRTIFGLSVFKKNYNSEQSAPKKLNRHSSSVSDVLFDNTQLEKISELNKHFMGIKMNTDYAKYYNQDSFSRTMEFKGRNISELPFKNSEKLVPKSISSLAQHIIDKISSQKLEKRLLQASQNYFKDLINKTRDVKVQPNFDREGRRVIFSLINSGYKFSQVQNQQEPALNIINVSLIHGIQVIRNNNYSSDSYKIVHEQNGLTKYVLWTQKNQKLAEQQLKSQRNMIMRIETEIKNVSNLKIVSPDQKNVIDTSNDTHHMIFQINLTHPPKFANFRLSFEQYLASYRINLNDIIVTNIDNRNPYFSLTFSEKQKKTNLINKLK